MYNVRDLLLERSGAKVTLTEMTFIYVRKHRRLKYKSEKHETLKNSLTRSNGCKNETYVAVILNIQTKKT